MSFHKWLRRRRQAWHEAQLPVQFGAIYRPSARIRRHPIRTWLDPGWEVLDPPSLPVADAFRIGSLGKFEGFGRVWQDSLRIYRALEYLYQSPIAQQGWVDAAALNQARGIAWNILHREAETWEQRKALNISRSNPELADEVRATAAYLDQVDGELAVLADKLDEAAAVLKVWQREQDAAERARRDAQQTEELRATLTRDTQLPTVPAHTVDDAARDADEIAQAVRLRITAARELLALEPPQEESHR